MVSEFTYQLGTGLFTYYFNRARWLLTLVCDLQNLLKVSPILGWLKPQSPATSSAEDIFIVILNLPVLSVRDRGLDAWNEIFLNTELKTHHTFNGCPKNHHE